MKTLFLLLSIVLSTQAYAGMVLDKTRIIFPQGSVTEGLTIMNMNDYPSFIQSWVDNGDVNNFKQDADSPFIIIPPVFSLNGQEIKSVKIIYDGRPLPDNRESLYWVNVYQVPAIKTGLTDKQYLLMSMKMQIKLIYRPDELKTGAEQSRGLVTCAVDSDSGLSLICKNKSGYYMSYESIVVVFNNQTYAATAKLGLMINPFSESHFALEKKSAEIKSKNNTVSFNVINDKGTIENIEKPLTIQ